MSLASLFLFQRVVRVKKTDEAEEEGVELSQEEITALSHGTTPVIHSVVGMYM